MYYTYVFLWGESIASITFLNGPRKWNSVSSCGGRNPCWLQGTFCLRGNYGFISGRTEIVHRLLSPLTRKIPQLAQQLGNGCARRHLGGSDSRKNGRFTSPGRCSLQGIHRWAVFIFWLRAQDWIRSSYLCTWQWPFPRGSGGKGYGNGCWVLNSNPSLFLKQPHLSPWVSCSLIIDQMISQVSSDSV